MFQPEAMPRVKMLVGLASALLTLAAVADAAAPTIATTSPAGGVPMFHCPKQKGHWDFTHLRDKRRSKSMDIGNGARWEKERRKDTLEWHLSLAENVEHGDLGLRNFDSNFKYGSPEADRRVERMGYCRVHMPTVPNSGSSWFKLMFEVATGRPTASVWPEGGKNQRERHYFMSESICGANADKFGGTRFAPRVCRNVTFPGPSDTVVVKSHQPFHPSISKIDPNDACMVVLLVRNPLDTFKPGYDKDGQPIYPFTWAMHNRHWVDEKDVPVFIFRYEDLVRDPQGTLERLLRVLPGFTWSKESISRAVKAYKPQRISSLCGKGSVYFTNRALTVMKEDFGGTLWRFGYTLSKEHSAGTDGGDDDDDDDGDDEQERGG